MQVVLASHNAHKLDELRRIIGPLVPEIELISYIGPEPIENGSTFTQNALLKARAAAEHTGLPAIADDSGIAVDILGGSPGIFSARWSGPEKDDRHNLELLLWQLSDVDDEHRQAEFVCAAALALPSGDEDVRLGRWRGTILREPSGSGGFGYDPIFQPDGYPISSAELSRDEKDAVSHRALAFQALVPLLQALVKAHD
jgi:XTP/dITP diphosphohydrolase